ncbi:MAG: iron-containing alcohol dehydrogenase [Candidatus Thermoplasmatota archaeon]|nr:iron-containing alcohol dehydrogenase [Candidatus Thermoplasmatota archaeon]
MKGDLRFGTDISYGWGILDRLGDLLPEGDAVLVLGRSSAKVLDLEKKVREHVHSRVEVFSGVEPNPLSITVEKGAGFIKETRPDLVIAAGGGSVMDAAKFMSVIARHGGTVLDYIEGTRSPPDSGYPVYAIPTTPGTSSEITPFSVVTVPERSNKLGLRHPAIYPKRAIIDPSLTVLLPKDQTAATGLDILSHAVESYWSKNATPLTREFSLGSVRLLRKHLMNAYEHGTDREAREGVSLASIFAGMAFSNNGTTICHAISYPITFDTGLPHGMACALTLGPTFDLLVGRDVDGMGELASSFGSTEGSFREDLLSFMTALNVPTRLSQIGFTGGAQRVIASGLGNFLHNFTIEVTEDDVMRIIDMIGR